MVSVSSFRLRVADSFLSDSVIGVIYVVCMLTWCRLCLYRPMEEAECCDVFDLDEELLEVVPKPVLAVLLLSVLQYLSHLLKVFHFFGFCG